MKYALLVGAFLVFAGLGLAKLKTSEKPSAGTAAAATERLHPSPVAKELPEITLSKPDRPAAAPAPKPAAEQTPPSAEEVQKEDALLQNLQDDKSLSQIADVENVSCEDRKCEIRFEAKGEDNSLIMDRMVKFLMSHPEYGTHFVKDDVKDNPKAALLTVSTEKL